jgi:uncharacterized protein YfkK (UPF0435 family)
MDEIKSLEDVKEIAESNHFDKLPSLNPKGVAASSVMNLSVAVDSEEMKPQELKTLRPFYDMVQSLPSTLPAEAQMIGQALFSVFERGREVKEGQLKDLVWGFAQCGFEPKLSVVGLFHLQEAGYIRLQAPSNEYVAFTSTQIEECWVRYQKKLLDLVYSG